MFPTDQSQITKVINSGQQKRYEGQPDHTSYQIRPQKAEWNGTGQIKAEQSRMEHKGMECS